MASGLTRPDGTLDARTALAPYRGTWDERLAAHVLRRAGFGGTPQEIAAAARSNPRDVVESLVHFTASPNLTAPADLYDPTQELLGIRQLAAADRMEKLKAVRMASRQSIVSLQMWWLNRMLTTPAPLQEKMTLFFHGHFTTAAIQKGVWPNYVYNQNQLFRENALGNLRDLTLAVSKDPAMLLYLDNASNNKAHPNENYARELMELFTLGHGNYSEEDIRQSARAFTGWTVSRLSGEFVDNARIHDAGVKTFLGKSGNFDGADIVSIIYQQPAASKFWASTLLNYFVYNDPEPQLVEELASVIRKYDFNLAPVMSALLQSNVFFSPRAYRALVKSPVEFVVGTHKTFALPEIVDIAPRALNQMGQILFYPPNVAGWPGGQNWITSQTTIARQNFLAQLSNSPMMGESAWLEAIPTDADRASFELIQVLLQGDAPDAARAQLLSYLNGASTSALKSLGMENFQERVRGAAYLAMAMPAYQLA